MNDKANIQCSRLMKMDDTMLMYGVYNAETLEKLFKYVHKIHNTTISHERLFAGTNNPANLEYCMHILLIYNISP